MPWSRPSDPVFQEFHGKKPQNQKSQTRFQSGAVHLPQDQDTSKHPSHNPGKQPPQPIPALIISHISSGHRGC